MRRQQALASRFWRQDRCPGEAEALVKLKADYDDGADSLWTWTEEGASPITMMVRSEYKDQD